MITRTLLITRRFSCLPALIVVCSLCCYAAPNSAAQSKPRQTHKRPPVPAPLDGCVNPQSPLVRVCLLRYEGARQITVNALPGARLLGAQGRESAAGTGPWTFTATSTGVQVTNANGQRLGILDVSQYWRVQTEDSTAQLGIRGTGSAFRHYRGSLEIRGVGGQLRLINEVGMEPYLCGVVISEIGDGPLEAIKAQAIAARTYAISSRGRWKADGYDLRDTVDSQAYSGVESETSEGNRAVWETSGWILTQKGQAIDADFCDDCGGVTAPGDDPNVLPRSVSDAEAHRNIRHAPYSVWSLTLTGDKLTALLGRSRKARGAGTLQNVEILQKDVSGRAQRVRLTWGTRPKEEEIRRQGDKEKGRQGEGETEGERRRTKEEAIQESTGSPEGHNPQSTIFTPQSSLHNLEQPSPTTFTEINGEALRGLIGYNVLRSTLFAVRRLPSGEFQFEGKGWGHGHGLCQQGALALAAAPLNQSCAAILLHYYPGALLTRMPQAEAEGVNEEGMSEKRTKRKNGS